jgi:hypothetical protein
MTNIQPTETQRLAVGNGCNGGGPVLLRAEVNDRLGSTAVYFTVEFEWLGRWEAVIRKCL